MDIVRRLAESMRPNGYNQVVDGMMQVVEIKERDLPSQKLFKTMRISSKTRGLGIAMG